MSPGDLVRLGESSGIVIWSHPKGKLVKVHWSDSGGSWEIASRLSVISKIIHSKTLTDEVQLIDVD